MTFEDIFNALGTFYKVKKFTLLINGDENEKALDEVISSYIANQFPNLTQLNITIKHSHEQDE